MRIGRRGAAIEFMLLLGLAFILPGIAVLGGWAPVGVLLCWLAVPMAVLAVRQLMANTGKALNKVLALTARFVLLHGALLAAGFLSALI